MSTHRPRLYDGHRMLGTRKAAALLTGRHPNLVRRYCEPVACDARSRAVLYDLDDAVTRLRTRQRRVA